MTDGKCVDCGTETRAVEPFPGYVLRLARCPSCLERRAEAWATETRQIAEESDRIERAARAPVVTEAEDPTRRRRVVND